MQVSSRFGQVLLWVIKRLEEVKADMVANCEGREDVKNSISIVSNFIRLLLESAQGDATLQKKFSQIPEAEYLALVHMIKEHNIDMTDDLREGSNKMLDSFKDEDLKIIQLARELLDKL